MSKTKYLVFWNPYEEIIHFSKANFFLDIFAHDQTVVTVDLKNNKDPRSQSLLREADLVVVFLKQDEICLNHYFLHNLVRNEHVIYVIADYIYDGLRDWPQILDRYRIPQGELFVLPYSHRLQFLNEQDGIACVTAKEEDAASYENIVGFSRSYRNLRKKIYESLR